MGKERRSFSEEFKEDAVRRVAAGERGLSHIARELGIHPSLLQTWRRNYGSTGSAKATAKPPTSLEDENRRLRRDNAALREDREVLKKRLRSLRKNPGEYAFIEEQRRNTAYAGCASF